MKLFIDAMGGDQAPKVVVAGTAVASQELKSELILLGDQSVLQPMVAKFFKRRRPPEIIHCSETIGMSESAVQSVRGKKDSSIVRGLELAHKTPDSAFFSAGHTGACFAAALMAMGRIEGVERPAIATALPSITGHCILLDAGANIDVRAAHLVTFAYMGSVYAQAYLKKPSPRVGILSNGEEDSKGTEVTREANQILKTRSDLNYRGYVEGKEIFDGSVDIVVTDGYTGNIVLKSLEGLGKTITSIIKAEIGRNSFTKMGALLALPALNRVQKKLDYASVGSAPLLGVSGNCFIGHGRSNSTAIRNGLCRAEEAIEMKLLAHLEETFKRGSS